MTTLNATKRVEIKKAVEVLRKNGKLPGVMYGHKIKPLNITLDYSAFEKAFKAAGESTLIDVTIENESPVKAIIQDYQYDPKTNRFIHVDLHQVAMDEKMHAEIPLKFIGEAPAVKELGGTLVTNIDTLSVECLPGDLVYEIEVDLSSLKAFEDAIHISDINVPAGMKVLDAAEETVVLVQEPRTEAELEALDQAPEVKLPEGAEEKKTDEPGDGSKESSDDK